MVTFTKSFGQWIFRFHKDIAVLLMFGHTELLTDELWKEYIEWCQSDEGRQFLSEDIPKEG